MKRQPGSRVGLFHQSNRVIGVRVQSRGQHNGLSASGNESGRLFRNAVDDDAQTFAFITKVDVGADRTAAKTNAGGAA